MSNSGRGKDELERLKNLKERWVWLMYFIYMHKDRYWKLSKSFLVDCREKRENDDGDEPNQGRHMEMSQWKWLYNWHILIKWFLKNFPLDLFILACAVCWLGSHSIILCFDSYSKTFIKHSGILVLHHVHRVYFPQKSRRQLEHVEYKCRQGLWIVWDLLVWGISPDDEYAVSSLCLQVLHP
jgi:hypothetical protein